MNPMNSMNEKFPGLYIHIPFCLSKCPYCDFYSLTSISAVPDFLDALFKEMEMYRNRFNPFDPSAASRLRRELSRTPALQSRDKGALRVNPEPLGLSSGRRQGPAFMLGSRRVDISIWNEDTLRQWHSSILTK